MPHSADNPLSQDGNEVSLNLGDIDPKLRHPGKSIEDITDPEARLFVLWTTIGQYRAIAEIENHDDGTTESVVNDAKYHNLLSTWTREARRLNPLIRFSEFPGVVTSLVENGEPVEAYAEILQLRSVTPELYHPDTRFTALDALRGQAVHQRHGLLLSKLIGRDMLDESMPGGAGHCDDAERIRRYLVLKEDFPYLGPVIRDFAQDVQLGPTSQYFDNDTPGIEDICTITASRRYRDVAEYLLQNVALNFDSEVVLLPLTID
jgi:hypothetical protein